MPAIEDKIAKEGGDITDYFNYGFDKETWKSYAERIRLNYDTYEHMQAIQESYQPQAAELAHPTLNFLMPHDLGSGLMTPLDEERFKYVNTYNI